MEGGCQAPIAAHATLTPLSPSLSTVTLSFIGRVLSLDGKSLVEVRRDVTLSSSGVESEKEGGREGVDWSAWVREGERVGVEAAEEALRGGAGDLIHAARMKEA